MYGTLWLDMYHIRLLLYTDSVILCLYLNNTLLQTRAMKVDINKKLIDHVAEVARLKLTDKEGNKFVKELKEVIDTFSKLDEVNTKNIDISLQPVELRNVLREDNEESCLSQEAALSLTDHKKDGYFKGPKAI